MERWPDPICGNGTVEEGETCDDGNAVTEECPPNQMSCDICDSTCQARTVTNSANCGNGIVEGSEECDDGNTATENCDPFIPECIVCSENCEVLIVERQPECGDGHWEHPEECDDGNTIHEECPYGDIGCTVCGALCTYVVGETRFCGDGVIQTADGENCDDGNQITETCAAGELECTVCDASCVSRELVIEPTCGNHILEGSEVCDQGPAPPSECAYGDTTCMLCDAACNSLPSVPRYCGDGAVDADLETCDDENSTAGDGCDEQCQLEDGFYCTTDICVPVCGDGLVVGSETCDDGNTDAFDGCSDSCALETGYQCTDEPSSCMSTCGDGITAHDEQCDDGNPSSQDGCAPNCTTEEGYYCDTLAQPATCSISCGDGVKASIEECDDGNFTNGDGCSEACGEEDGFLCIDNICEPICGDGQIRGTEECDDGNSGGLDGCSDSCTIEFRYSCEEIAGQPSVCETQCGNGQLDRGEACDPQLTPSSCTFDCLEESHCGDGHLDTDEECDDGNEATGDGCTASCEIEDGYTCEVVPPSIIRSAEDVVTVDAKETFVYWLENGPYIDRHHLLSSRWERQRIPADADARSTILDIAADSTGVFALSRETSASHSEQQLWWFSNADWGTPSSAKRISLPVSFSQLEVQWIATEADRLVFAARNNEESTELHSVGIRRILSSETCDSLTERSECSEWTHLASATNFEDVLRSNATQTYLWAKAEREQNGTPTTNWFGLSLSGDAVDVSQCASSPSCLTSPMEQAVLDVALFNDEILFLSDTGFIDAYSNDQGVLVDIWSKWENPDVLDIAHLATDGSHLWANSPQGLNKIIAGLGLDDAPAAVSESTARFSSLSELGWVSWYESSSGLDHLVLSPRHDSSCSRPDLHLISPDGDLYVSSVSADGNGYRTASGYVSGQFLGHPSGSYEGAGNRDGWLMQTNALGHQTKSLVWQSKDTQGNVLETEDRIHWVKTDQMMGDIWIGATACKGYSGQCVAQWSAIREGEWQSLPSEDLIVEATGESLGTIVKADPDQRILSQATIRASNLDFGNTFVDDDGSLYVPVVFQGELTIYKDGQRVYPQAETDPQTTPNTASALLKLRSSGELAWVKPFHSSGNLVLNSVQTYALANGETTGALVGWFTGRLDSTLGSQEAEGFSEDGLLTIFHESGGAFNHERSMVFAAENNNRTTGVTIHPDGSLWVTGWSQSSINLKLNETSTHMPIDTDLDAFSFAFAARISMGGHLFFNRTFRFGPGAVRATGVSPLDRGGALIVMHSEGSGNHHFAQLGRIDDDGTIPWTRTIETTAPGLLRPVLPVAYGRRQVALGFQAKIPAPVQMPIRVSNAGEGEDDTIQLGASGYPYQNQAIIATIQTEPFDPACSEGLSCVAVCGDGFRTANESCDDGNAINLDGCSADCTIESGFTCFGERSSVCFSQCGDGILSSHETCDDANRFSGDGCSSNCLVENGYLCKQQDNSASHCFPESEELAHCVSGGCVTAATTPAGRVSFVGSGCNDGPCETALDRCTYQQIGVTSPCGSTKGECSEGYRSCTNDLVWDVCIGATGPVPEQCDGLDNDCDGEVDEDIPALTCGQGACRNTVTACIDQTPQTCEPYTVESEEICNGTDDDCDGEIDEGLPSVITCGEGTCAKTVLACEDGIAGLCEPGDPSPETCDGFDNDCNGIEDDLEPVVCGRGPCVNEIIPCADGLPVACVPKNNAVNEFCDGRDNDCDGSIDEDLDFISAGDGVCENRIYSCEDGSAIWSTEPLEADSRETCNFLDDDCDGQVDENLNCKFSCSLYREAKTCCNLWFADQVATVGEDQADTVCSSLEPNHPCCDPLQQDYLDMLQGVPDNDCCDLSFPWVNHGPLLFPETKFVQEAEHDNTCIVGREDAALPEPLAQYLATYEMDETLVQQDLYTASPDVCSQPGEQAGLVTTWSWNPNRLTHELGAVPPCGLYVRYYDEDFSQHGPRIDVQWSDGTQSTVTAEESCLYGTSGYSYTDPFQGETPAYYQHIVPVPEDGSGLLRAQFDITDADGAFVSRQLSVVASELPVRQTEEIACTVEYYDQGSPVFTWFAQERCALAGGTCDNQTEYCVHEDGCTLKKENYHGACDLEELGTEFFFRRLSNSGEAYGTCSSLAGTAFCNPDAPDAEGLCPNNPFCDDPGESESGICHDTSTEVEVYLKADSCRFLVLDEEILDPQAPNRFGLDADVSDTSYTHVFAEAERLTACCRNEADECCDGASTCGDLGLSDTAINDSLDGQVKYVRLETPAETTCNGETASYLSVRFDVSEDGLKEIGFRQSEHIFSARFKAGNQLPTGFIYDSTSDFVDGQEDDELLADYVLAEGIEVVIGETFTLRGEAFDDDPIRSEIWRIGDGLSQRGSALTAYYTHPTKEDQTWPLRFEVTDRNNAMNWENGSLGTTAEDRPFNEGAQIPIRVLESPHWLSLDKTDFVPALDTTGTQLQTVRFLIDSETDVGGVEIAFNRREADMHNGKITWDSDEERFIKTIDPYGSDWFDINEEQSTFETLPSGETQVNISFSLRTNAYSPKSAFQNWIDYRFLDQDASPLDATGANPNGWFLWPLDFDILDLHHQLKALYGLNGSQYTYQNLPIAADAIITVAAQGVSNKENRRTYHLTDNWTEAGFQETISLDEPSLTIDYGDGTAGTGEAHRYAYPDGYHIEGTLDFGSGWVVPTSTIFLKFSGDADEDGIPNYEDPDNDNDGYCDLAISIPDQCEAAQVCTDENNPATCTAHADAFPLDPSQWSDRDGDGHGDNPMGCRYFGLSSEPTSTCREDDFPDDPNEQIDTDGDGIGDNADPDDDNDGLTDVVELEIGTLPHFYDSDNDFLNDGAEYELMGEALALTDSDGDGWVNILDKDADNDGLIDGQEMKPDTDFDEDGLIAVVDADSDDDGVVDGDDGVPVGWPNQLTANFSTGSASSTTPFWRTDLPEGFLQTNARVWSIGMKGYATRREWDTGANFNPLSCFSYIKGGNKYSDVIYRSTDSEYVSRSDFSLGHIAETLESQLEETPWVLAGSLSAQSGQLHDGMWTSWGGTGGCHPNQFLFEYDVEGDEYSAPLASRSGSELRQEETGDHYSYHLDSIALGPGVANRFSMELTGELDYILSSYSADGVDLFLDITLLRPGFSSTASLIGEEIFHHTVVRAGESVQQNGEPIYTIEYEIPNDVIDTIADHAENTNVGLPRAQILIKPMYALTGGQDDGQSGFFNGENANLRITALIQKTGGLVAHLITRRSVSNVSSIYSPASCTEDSQCPDTFCDVDSATCSPTAIPIGQLKANVFGLTYDEPDTWPEDNTDRVNIISEWSGVQTFADGTSIYVVNKFKEEHPDIQKCLLTGDCTSDIPDAILLIGNYVSEIAEMKKQLFQLDDVDLVCGDDAICSQGYEFAMQPQWFNFDTTNDNHPLGYLDVHEESLFGTEPAHHREVTITGGFDGNELPRHQEAFDEISFGINTFIRHVAASAFGIFNDPKFGAEVGLFEDITPRKKRQDELASANVYLKELFFAEPKWDKKGVVFDNLPAEEKERIRTYRDYLRENYSVTLELRPFMQNGQVLGWEFFEVGNEWKRKNRFAERTRTAISSTTNSSPSRTYIKGFDTIEVNTVFGKRDVKIPPDNDISRKWGIDFERSVRDTSVKLNTAGAFTIAGFLLDAGDALVAYRSGDWKMVLYYSALGTLNLAAGIQEYKQTYQMMTSLSNVKAQKLSRFGKSLKFYGKFQGPILGTIAIGFLSYDLVENWENPVLRATRMKALTTTALDMGIAGTALFISPGVGQAAAVIYTSWAAVSVAASIAGVHPMAHSLVGTPTAAASTLYDYFVSDDIPPEFCEEALNKALSEFHEFIIHASDNLDYWVVPLWPPGTDPSQ